MNERSTHLNAFIYDSTPVPIVSQRYSTLLISSTTVVVSNPRHRRFRPCLPIVVLFLRRSIFHTPPLCEPHEPRSRLRRLPASSSPPYPSSTPVDRFVITSYLHRRYGISVAAFVVPFIEHRGVESSRFRRLWPDQYHTIRVHRHHVIVSSPLSSPKQERTHRRIASSMIVVVVSNANDTPPDSAAQRTLRAGVSCLRHRRLHHRRHPSETCIVVFLQSLRLAYRRNFVTRKTTPGPSRRNISSSLSRRHITAYASNVNQYHRLR